MIENRNESELESYLRRAVKPSGNQFGSKSDRGNEKGGLHMVSNTIHANELYLISVLLRFSNKCMQMLLPFEVS